MDESPAGAPLAGPVSGARPTPRRQRPAWRTVLGILIVLLIALAAAFALKQCAGKGGARRGRPPATTVGTAKVAAGQIPINLDALGTVTPLATVNVTSRIAGQITRIAFREGQMVKAGDLLAQVDPRPYQVALQQAQGQLMRDQAALANAQVLLSRDQTLLAQDSIARQDVDTQAAAVKQDQASVVSDQAAVASARLNLAYCRITAPVSGRVGLRQIDLGNYVTAGSGTPIVVITQIDPIDVAFTVPETQIQTVADRMRSGASLPVQALDRAGGTVLASGKLLTLDNQIDVSTGTVKAKARFANPGGTLFPNQFVNVRLLVNTLDNALIVPGSAVRHGPQGDFVWVLQPDETAHMQTVTVGPAAGERTSILSGLKAGQTVITEGGDRLREGAPVALPGRRPPMEAGRFGGRGGRFHGRGGHHRRRGGQRGDQGGGAGG